MRAAGADPDCRVTPASIVGREAHPDPKPPAFQALAEGQFGAMQFRDASRDGQAEADALDSEADSAMPGAPIKKPLPNRQGLWREGRFNAPAQPSSYYLLP